MVNDGLKGILTGDITDTFSPPPNETNVIDAFKGNINKREQVIAASQEKTAGLLAQKAAYRAELQAEEDAKAARAIKNRLAISDETLDNSILARGANAVIGAAGTVGEAIGSVYNAGAVLNTFASEQDITQGERAINARILDKQKQRQKIQETINYSRTLDASPEQKQIWEAQLTQQHDAIINTDEENAFIVNVERGIGAGSDTKYETLRRNAERKKQVIDPAREFFGGISNRVKNTKFTEAAMEQSTDIWENKITPTYNKGIEELAKGDNAAAAQSIASSFAQGAAGIGEVILDNPTAIVSVLAESLPQMYMLAKTSATVLFSAVDTADKAKDTFVKKYDRNPVADEIATIVVGSLVVHSLDKLGAGKVLGSGKNIGKGTNKGAAVAIGSTAGSAVVEGATEAAQDILEQFITQPGQVTVADTMDKLSKINFGQTLGATALGAGAGGGITAAINTPALTKGAAKVTETATKTAAQGTRVAASKVSTTAKDTLEVNEAVRTGEVADIVDESAPDYKAEKAVRVLLRTLPEEAAPIETKETHLAEIQAHFDSLKEEAIALTPKINAAKPGSKADKRLRNKQQTIVHTLDKLNTHIEGYQLRIGETDAAITKLVADSTEASASRVVKIMGSSPNSISLQQAETVLSAGNLTPEQTTQVEQFIEVKKSLADVSGDIAGTTKQDPGNIAFVSIPEHMSRIGQAIEANNEPRAQAKLARLNEFTERHTNKLALIKEGIPLSQELDKGELSPIKQAKLDSIIDALSTTDPTDKKKSHAFRFITNVGPVRGVHTIVDTVTNEVAALNTALDIAKLNVTNTFGKVTAPVVTPTETVTEDVAPEVVTPTPKTSTPVDTKAQPRVATTVEKKVETKPTPKAETVNERAIREFHEDEEASIKFRENEKAKLTSKAEPKAKPTESLQDKVAREFGEETKTFSLAKDTIENAKGREARTTKKGEEIPGIKNEAAEVLQPTAVSQSKAGKNYLQTTKDFFSGLTTGRISIKEMALTKSQAAALKRLNGFNEKMTGHFLNDVYTEGRSTNFDSINYLAQKDGKLPGNVISAINMGSLNYLANEVSGDLYNNKESINKILGQKPDTRLIPGAIELLGTRGVMEKNLAATLGANIRKIIGIEAQSTADGHIQGNLDMALGHAAIATMVHAGLLQRSFVRGDQLDSITSTKAILDGDGTVAHVRETTFIRATTSSKKVLGTGGQEYDTVNRAIESLTNLVQASDGVLDKLFGIESRVTWPSLRKPGEVRKNITNSSQLIPEATRASVTKYNQIPNNIKTSNHTVVDFLTREQVYAMEGYTENVEGTIHVTEVESTNAKNLEIIRNVNDYFTFTEQLADKLKTPFYLTSGVTKNMRIQMEGLINTQTKKFHRHMITQKQHEVEINPSTYVENQQFLLAVADSLGVGTDKQDNLTSFDQLETLLEDESIVAGLAAITTVLFSPDTISTTEHAKLQGDILAATKKGKEKTYSLDGLIAYATMEHADGKPFKTDLFREVDGITNGILISTLQFAAAKDRKDFTQKLARAGMFTDNTDSYGQWNATPGNMDTYRTLTTSWDSYLTDVKDFFASETLTTDKVFNENIFKLDQVSPSDLITTTEGQDAITEMVGNLFESVNGINVVSSLGRTLAKEPLLSVSYGSALDKVVTDLAEGRLAALYKKLATFHDKDAFTQDEFTEFEALMSTLQGSPFYLSSKEVSLNFEFDAKTKNRILSAIEATYGRALEMAIDSQFAPLLAERNRVNEAMNFIFEGFSVQLDAATNKAEAQKRKDTGNAKATLTRKEREGIVSSLSASQPIYQTFFSKGQEDGLLVMKTQQVSQTDKAFLTETKLKKAIPTTGERISTTGKVKQVTKAETINNYSSLTGYLEGGAAPTVMGIHAIDAAVMTMAIEQLKILGIHDAAAFDLKSVINGSQELNEIFLDVISKYSVMDSVNNSLQKAVKLMPADFITEKDATLKAAKLEKLSKLKKFPIAAIKVIENEHSSVSELVTKFSDAAKRVDADKATMLKDIRYVVQYNVEEGGKRVNVPTKADIDSAPHDLVTEVKENTDTTPEIAAPTTPVTEFLAKAKRTKSGAVDLRMSVQDKAFYAENIKEIQDVLAVQQSAGTSFSSSPNSIDPTNFNEDTVDELNASSSMTVFDRLGDEVGVEDSVEHREHLSHIMTSIVNKVIKPITLFSKAQGDENVGVFVEGKGIFTHTAPTIHSIANGTVKSQQEVYVHELIHHITNAAIDGSTFLTRQLTKLYSDIKKSGLVSWSDFLPDGVTEATADSFQEDAARDTFNYVMGNGANGKEIHEFVALALSNNNFRETLSKLDVGQVTQRVDKNESWLQQILGWFQKAMDWVDNTITHSNKLSIDAKVTSLIEQMIDIDNRQKGLLEQIYIQGASVTSKALNTAVYAIVAPTQKLLESDLVRKSGSTTVQKLGQIAELLPNTNVDILLNTVSDLNASMNVAEDGAAASFLTELKGRTKENSYIHDLVRYRNLMIDQARHKISANIGSHLLTKFNRQLTKHDRAAVTKVMLKTDMISLIESKRYSWSAIIRMVEDDVFLDQEIQKSADVIRNAKGVTPGQYNWYYYMGRSLGTEMATGVPTEFGHRDNAHSIVHAGEPGMTENSIEQAEAVKNIDVFASLVALRNTNKPVQRTNMAALMREEFNLAPDANLSNQYLPINTENGVTFTLLVHQANKKKALQESFSGQVALMKKGFTKEIYNPSMSFVVAPLSDQATLEKRGYQLTNQTIPKGHRDPNQKPAAFFTHRFGAMQSYSPGAVSLRGKRAAGTDLYDIHTRDGSLTPGLDGFVDTRRMTRIAGDNAAKIMSNPSTREKVGNTVAVPILNNQSTITGFRYRMNENSKDELLQKNNSFETILGAMEADIIDKTNTIDVNNKVIEALHEDYLIEYNKDPSRYTAIGPRAPDKQYREIYHMLPEEARQEISRVWGSDTMYVKTEVAVTVFGQRKISLTNLERKDDPNVVGIDAIKQMVNNALFTVTSRPGAAKIENIWIGGVKMVKDAIVIKSGGVLAGNIAYNAVLLKVKGVSAPDILRDHLVAYRSAREYQKDSRELDRLVREEQLLTSKQRKRDVLGQINVLKHKIQTNPVRELIELGIHQSIVEDIDMVHDQYSAKSALDTYLDDNLITKAALDKTPGVVKTGFKWATMQHDTPIYKLLLDATQLSDFASRYVLHKHNLTNKGMSVQDSIGDIVQSFINYDLPSHRYLQYANDIGLFMFTKFFLRIQKVLVTTLQENPGNVLGSVILHELFSTVPSVGEPNMITGSWLGKVHVDPWELFRNLFTAPLTADLVQ